MVNSDRVTRASKSKMYKSKFTFYQQPSIMNHPPSTVHHSLSYETPLYQQWTWRRCDRVTRASGVAETPSVTRNSHFAARGGG